MHLMNYLLKKSEKNLNEYYYLHNRDKIFELFTKKWFFFILVYKLKYYEHKIYKNYI